MTSTQVDVKDYSYFADNQWRQAKDNQVFEVHEPYRGELFARVAAGSREDARLAVDAASKAFAGWSDTTPAERARLFLKAAEIVKRRRTEIAEVLARETGSTISFATFQQDLVAATLQQVAGWVFLPKGEVLESNLPGTHSVGIQWRSTGRPQRWLTRSRRGKWFHPRRFTGSINMPVAKSIVPGEPRPTREPPVAGSAPPRSRLTTTGRYCWSSATSPRPGG
jgi:hypothetical protein